MNKLSDSDTIRLEILTCNTNINHLREGIDKVCSKIDKHDEKIESVRTEVREIKDSVLSLPCNGHIERMKGMGKSLDRAWKILITLIITGVLGVGVAVAKAAIGG